MNAVMLLVSALREIGAGRATPARSRDREGGWPAALLTGVRRAVGVTRVGSVDHRPMARSVPNGRTKGRLEVRCAGCGYGIVVTRLPDRCPMCGASKWDGYGPAGPPVGGAEVDDVREVR